MKINYNLTFIQLRIFSALILSFLSFSCNENKLNVLVYQYELEKIIVNDLSLNDQIIVIPGEGCGGCISDATSFVIENIAFLDRTIVIFTGVGDKKILRSRLSKIINYPNLYFDDDNYLMSDNLKSIYPYVINLENGKIKIIEEFDKNKIRKT